MHFPPSRRWVSSHLPLLYHLMRPALVGTVITINRSPDLKFTAPIRELLAHRDTGLRSTADPSLLIHGLLDLTVDRVIEVVDEYQAKILELEHDTLVYPKMRVVRDLHILQGDLIQHKYIVVWLFNRLLLTAPVGARSSPLRRLCLGLCDTTLTAVPRSCRMKTKTQASQSRGTCRKTPRYTSSAP